MTGLRERVRPLVPLLALLLGQSAKGHAQNDVASAAEVPSPAEVIGFELGTDYELADYSQVQDFFRTLARISPRVHLEEIGKSTQGRPLLLAAISSAENLGRLDRYREISRRLALAKDLSDEEARRLAKEGKVIVWIDGGLHATEVAHGQHMPELAHWLATAESEEARRIRENAIVLVMPNLNPDGLDIVVEWYERNLGTPFETTSPPILYHHYVGHDNNRDWNMFTQAETQVVARQVYHVWFPQIVYNHHQPAPFPARIWMPPSAAPINPNIDPLIVSSISHMGEAIRKRFEEEGKPGVISGVIYDDWWNGYMSDAPYMHNMVSFLTETALYRYATPHCYDPDELPETFGAAAGHLSTRRPSTNYTSPWLGGCWHLRDAMDYMMTASRAVASNAARLKEDYLYNIYRVGRRQIEKMRRAEDGPFAYVIDPSEQHDPGAAVDLLRVFRRGGVEIRRAEHPFSAGGDEYPAGTYVIPPQAFRPFIVDLMDPKPYPDIRPYPGGPPDPPYDVTGYELPFLLGVQVHRIGDPFAVPEPMVQEVPPPPGAVHGQGSYGYLLSPNSNANAKALNRLFDSGATVARAQAPFEAAGRSWPAGTIITQETDRDGIEQLARTLGLQLHAIDAAPAVQAPRLRAPRIGLYRSWRANIDEGWLRFILDQYGFRYESLTDSDIRRGTLGDYDIIILPSQGAERILNGHPPGTMPEEYVGGLGLEGAMALKRFVEDGGWLFAADRAMDFAVAQFGLPLRNRVRELRREDFYIPGSQIRIDVDGSDPLGFGMPEQAFAYFVNSQVLDVISPASDRGRGREHEVDVFARYATEDLVASGWALGAERHVAGRPAAVRVPMGAGQVVLVAFRPYFRAQSRNTYKLLFNALFASTVEGDPAPSGGGARGARPFHCGRAGGRPPRAAGLPQSTHDRTGPVHAGCRALHDVPQPGQTARWILGLARLARAVSAAVRVAPIVPEPNQSSARFGRNTLIWELAREAGRGTKSGRAAPPGPYVPGNSCLRCATA